MNFADSGKNIRLDKKLGEEENGKERQNQE